MQNVKIQLISLRISRLTYHISKLLSTSLDVSANRYLRWNKGGGLLCLPGLILWLAASVPKGGDMERVVFDEIDHLVQPADDDAPIGLLAMGE